MEEKDEGTKEIGIKDENDLIIDNSISKENNNDGNNNNNIVVQSEETNNIIQQEDSKKENWREWKPDTENENNNNNKDFSKLYSFQDGTSQVTEEDDSSWKDVNWDENREKIAKLVLDQEIDKLSIEERETYEKEASKRWDTFYTKHQNNFFKLRNYLHLEYPELLCLDETINEDEIYEKLREIYPKQPIKKKEKFIQIAKGETAKLLEIGCGTGSTFFPIIQLNKSINPTRNIYAYAFDFADSAVKIVKENELYNEEYCKAFVCDITENDLIDEIKTNQIHIAMLIFVLSAIDPSKMVVALKRIFDSLKPGGLLIFRDYGLYDMTQMRFVAKKRRKIDENFYMRADGTRTYFFSLEKISELMKEVGFETKELKFDTRELRNRKRGISMYRVWINGKFTKPI